MTECARGWIGYDGECPVCQRWVGRARDLLLARGYHFVPLQAAWARARFGLKEGEPLLEMKLLMADGRIYGGADAIIRIAWSIWWAWPVSILVQIPGIKTLLRFLYRRLARNRHCLGKSCPTRRSAGVQPRHITSAFYDIP